MKLQKYIHWIYRVFGFFSIVFFIFFLLVLFLVNSYDFQTWSGKKLSAWFTEKSGIQTKIEKIEIDFFNQIHIKNIFLGSKVNDTLLSSYDILLKIHSYDLKKQDIQINEIQIDKPVFVYHDPKKGISLLDSLIHFFSGTNTDDSTESKPWHIVANKICVKDAFVRISREDTSRIIPREFNNHYLTFSSTSFTLNHFQVPTSDTILLNIENLTTLTNFNITVRKLKTNAIISEMQLSFDSLYIQTERSQLAGSLFLTFDSLRHLSDFIDKVSIRLNLKPGTYIHFKDLGGFIPDWKCAEEMIMISGEFKGKVNDIIIQHLNVRYKNNTTFEGDLSLSGIPDIEHIFFHVKIKKMYVAWNELMELKIPPYCDTETIRFPKELLNMKETIIKGELNGTPSDVVFYGFLLTPLGTVKTDIELIRNKKFDWSYNGIIQIYRFHLGKFYQNSSFGELSCSMKIRGKGFYLNNMEIDAEGDISNLEFHNYKYSNIHMTGNFRKREFNGKLIINDSSLQLSFDGKLHLEKDDIQMDFISEIKKFNPEALHLFKTNEKGYFSTQMLIQLRGSDINNMSGMIHFDDTRFSGYKNTYKIQDFFLELEQNKHPKRIKLSSDIINADIAGVFRLTDIHEPLYEILNHYYPTFFKIKTRQEHKYSNEYSKINIKIKDFRFIHDVFISNINFSKNTILNLEVSRKSKKATVVFHSDTIHLGGIQLRNLNAELDEEDHIHFKTYLDEIYMNDSLKMKKVELCVNSRDKLSVFNIEWKGDTTTVKNSGEVTGKILFNNESFYLILDSAYAFIHDSLWTLTQSGIITWSKTGDVLVSPVFIKHKQEFISVEGGMNPDKEEEKISVKIENLNISAFRPVLSLYGQDLSGILHAVFFFNHKKDLLNTSASLSLENLMLNKHHLGNVESFMNWNHEEKSLELKGSTDLGFPDILNINNKNISFNGKIYPFSKEKNLDIEIRLHPMNTRFLNPLLKDIFTIRKGYAIGSVKMGGLFDDIQLNGKITLKNTEIVPDFTKVPYRLEGLIEIMPEQIRFSEINIFDNFSSNAKPNGVFNGNIFHKKFNRFQLDFDISYKKMLVLNTTEKDNSLYYGKVYGSGNIGLWGFLDNLHLSINHTIDVPSHFYLALDNPEEASEFDFIHFRKKDTLPAKGKKKDLSGFDLTMQIHATPDMSAHIIFDRTTNDALNANGEGNLSMNINTAGKFTMTGKYVIKNGDYKFSFEKLISKKFDLESGSSLLWTGDPINAEINVTAVYKNRVSIAPLINDTTGQYKSRTPVLCKLIMTRKLLNPDIRFEFEFPNINDNIKSNIMNILADDNERNRQVFAFLMLRSFLTPLIYSAHTGGVTAGNAAASTGSEFLSAKMNSFFKNAMGNFLGNMDIGINYNPGSQSSSDEFVMNMNKNFMNNRLTIEGNFGVNNNRTTTGNSSFIGDVNIEYKLSPDGKYKVRGFNRTNDVTQVTVTGGLYTQGVGIGVTENFNSWNELFRKYFRRKKQN